MSLPKFYLTLLFCLHAAAWAQLQNLPEPLIYFPFNEADFTALRALGAEQPPKAHNPEYLKWVEGASGKALYFDNDGQETKRGMISCQLPSDFELQSGFSIAAFIKTPPSLHRSRQYEIVSFTDTLSKGPGFRLMMSWRMLWLMLGDGDEMRSVRSSTSKLGIDPQQWYHIAAVYDGRGGAEVYLNGILLGSSKDMQVRMPEKRKLELRLGASASQGSGYGFEGCISALRIYNLPLSVEQINALAQME